MTKQTIKYEDIHTQEKRDNLLAQIHKVSKEIIIRFPSGKKESECPCCLSLNIRFYVEKNGFAFDRCSDCNHIFTNPFPSSDALDYYYNSDFKRFENQFFIDSFESRIPIFLKRLELIDLLGNVERILDVGAGIGLFLEANKRRYKQYEIESCDLSMDACERLRKYHPRAKIINCRFEEIEAAEYDCITIWDTFEHLVDPDLMLKSVKRLLRRGGFLLISTPNTNSFEWKVMDKDHVQLLPPGHVNLYNVDNISTVLGRCNFSLIAIHTLNPSLDLSYIDNVIRYQSDSECRRAANMLLRLVTSEVLYPAVEEYMINHRLGGNMVVIAKNNE
jgi:SAM-dependent methyltransferase